MSWNCSTDSSMLCSWLCSYFILLSLLCSFLQEDAELCNMFKEENLHFMNALFFLHCYLKLVHLVKFYWVASYAWFLPLHVLFSHEAIKIFCLLEKGRCRLDLTLSNLIFNLLLLFLRIFPSTVLFATENEVTLFSECSK